MKVCVCAHLECVLFHITTIVYLSSKISYTKEQRNCHITILDYVATVSFLEIKSASVLDSLIHNLLAHWRDTQSGVLPINHQNHIATFLCPQYYSINASYTDVLIKWVKVLQILGQIISGSHHGFEQASLRTLQLLFLEKI